jgi:two-component system sensor histidine kinase and response regulator WspE
MSSSPEWTSAFITEASDYLQKLENEFASAKAGGISEEQIDSMLRAAHTLKGAAQLMGFQPFSRLSHLLEDLLKTGPKWHEPSLFSQVGLKVIDALSSWIGDLQGKCEIKPSDFEAFCDGIKVALKTPETVAMETLVLNVRLKELCAKITPPIELAVKKEQAALPTIRIPEQPFNVLLNLVGELVIHHLKSEYRMRSLKGLIRQTSILEKRFYQLMEQLLICENSFESEVTSEISARSDELRKLREGISHVYDELTFGNLQVAPIVEELQKQVKGLRMLPLDDLFSEAPRVVREICGKTGKKVDLKISGGNTLLDKKIIEGVKASIMHLLRNAVDHGIEPPDERRNIGKPETGTISIKAYPKGEEVVVEIFDDGKGIDGEAIKKKALAKGFVSAEELERMSEEALLEFVFRKGFSEYEDVSDVSGRGIGLDIVKKDVEYLRGQVKLQSKQGKGTKFQLVLPISITIVPVELLEVAGQRFGIPTTHLRGSEFLSKGIDPTAIHFEFAGEKIPLIDLAQVLGLDHRGHTHSSALLAIESGNVRGALLVDRILGEEVVFLQSLGDYVGKIPVIRGVATRVNGEILVVLDSQGILADPVPRLAQSMDEVPLHEKRRVLVVDGSQAVCVVQREILSQAGYEVVTAHNGHDGLQLFKDGRFALVISDWELPIKNGYEMCRQIRRQEGPFSVPLIILSTMGRSRIAKELVEIGVDAFLEKKSFQEAEYLKAVKQLAG